MALITDAVVTAISGLVAEVQDQMEASEANNQQRQVKSMSRGTSCLSYTLNMASKTFQPL